MKGAYSTAATNTRRRRLQVCAEGRLARRIDLLDLLIRRGYVVELETCLDECTRCESCAFALACGRMVFAPTPEELVAKLS